ncbi:MAG: DNA methyltransferase, partial [Methanofastidiosum sp.]
RIIQASSNEGDVVLDPFCGCGTAVTVAEKLNRRWIGIDVTYLAIDLIQRRLQDSFKKDLSPFEVQGTPTDLESARSLAKRDRYQFEWWAVSTISARPAKDKKKGTDKGVDGYIFFYERENDRDVKTIIAQAKSGNVGVKDIRDFAWTTNREEAIIGAFITLQEPTEPMKKEALSAGVYKCEYTNKTYQKIQILTIEEILNGKKLDRPEGIDATFKKAERKSKVS